MKEWILKCIQPASIKDELVDCQVSIDVMEQQLQEYSVVINEQKNTIDDPTCDRICDCVRATRYHGRTIKHAP